MPEKPKSKPDDAKYNKKIDELEEKVARLKKERKEKKDSYKNGSQQFTDQIEAERANIRLAKACLVVLNFDKEELGHEIDEVENKISSHRRKIDLLGRPQERVNRNVKLEEMNASELAREEDRILQDMSTLSLSKAE
jgi:chromosome segregation ATPase